MANLSQLRQGIGERLRTITTLQVHDYMVGNIQPPAAMVGGLAGDGLLEYDYTMGRGRDRWELTVWLFIEAGDLELGQVDLDPYLDHSGALSIKEAIEDTSVGGDILNTNAETIRVMGARDYGEYTIGGTDVIGVEFRVEVIAQ